MILCTVTDRASGPCQKCGEFLRTGHATDIGLFCSQHCPVCSIQGEWGEFKPTEGEQLDLISGMGGIEEYPG